MQTQAKAQMQRRLKRIVYNTSLFLSVALTLGLSSLLGNGISTSVYAEEAPTKVVASDLVNVERKTQNQKQASRQAPAPTTQSITNNISIEEATKENQPRALQATKVAIVEDIQAATSFDSVSNDAGKTLVNKVEEKKVDVLEDPTVPTPEPTPEPSLSDILSVANTDEEYIWLYLTASVEIGGAGMTKAGAAAVMGCIQAESNFRTEALNSSDGGYGLLQWTNTVGASRRDNLVNWCNNNQLDPSTLIGQLKFAVHELQTKYSSASGYKFAVYEALTTSEDIAYCLEMFFCHAEAGTDVPVSSTYIYGGHTSTLDMFNRRLSYAYNFYSNLG